ncbi:hypothetical protein [Hydrogenophaga sp. PAMC20947]|uniref:hypothetical protein n=1 Tax=Hydrogenophaga sp. PAMC20947 TaxID=2565558 RepID=UPI00109D83A8|nr:hypothetical protein [Hydrogenophaga sp. PAMC20947]QCB47449.1 hypothetical protein E5678_16330 [Hydrogenophaga sp. PAMC20947]
MQNIQPINTLARRQFGRLALGGAAALALAACGGGSDGRDSDSQRSLLDVYNKLEDGMGPKEVTDLVGRTSESIGGASYLWQNTSESLSVHFNHKQGTQISGAHWYIGSSQTRAKLFNEV